MVSPLPTIFAILSALAVTVAAQTLTTQSEFCSDVDCPPYTVLERTFWYELRRYPKASWVTYSWWYTTHLSVAEKIGMKELSKYLEGDNMEHEKINMTLPLLGKAELDESHSYGTNWEYSLYAPGSPIPPRPGSGLSITTTPQDLEVYVHAYAEFTRRYDEDYAAIVAGSLRDMLLDDGHSFYDNFCYTASYRRNDTIYSLHEIWYEKKGGPVWNKGGPA